MNYEEYISSARWRRSAARLGELEAAGFRCRTCYALPVEGEPLEVHHRTYLRFGYELVGDLTALCRKCHRGVTAMLRGRRYALLLPMVIDNIPLIENRPPLFDPTTTGASS